MIQSSRSFGSGYITRAAENFQRITDSSLDASWERAFPFRFRSLPGSDASDFSGQIRRRTNGFSLPYVQDSYLPFLLPVSFLSYFSYIRCLSVSYDVQTILSSNFFAFLLSLQLYLAKSSPFATRTNALNWDVDIESMAFIRYKSAYKSSIKRINTLLRISYLCDFNSILLE